MHVQQVKKALAIADVAALQEELKQLREKNSRKSVLIREMGGQQQLLQQQLAEKVPLLLSRICLRLYLYLSLYLFLFHCVC